MRLNAFGEFAPWGRIIFAVLFVAAGLMHFLNTSMYLRIMPPEFPQPRLLVLLSGLAEVALGALLLVRRARTWAAWGLIALLVAVFPANWFMWRHADLFPSIPPTVLLIRLPLQAVLIAWAWRYTRPTLSIRPETRRSAALVGLIGVSLLLGGCGRGSLARLDKGTMARAHSIASEPVTVYFAASEEVLAPDTVVRVDSDAEGTIGDADRRVLVGFLEGPHQGLSALVRRRDLQPNP